MHYPDRVLRVRPANHPLDRYRHSTAMSRAAAVSAPRARSRIGTPESLIPGVVVIVPSIDHPNLIIPLLDELAEQREMLASTGLDLRVIVADTGTTDPTVLARYAAAPPWIEVVDAAPYHFARSVNTAARGRLTHSLTLLLNNDVSFAKTPDAILLMAHAISSCATETVAGLALDFPDGTVQHRGIDVIRDDSLYPMVFHPGAHEPSQHLVGDSWEAIAATGACLMLPTRLFADLGGLDEAYERECQDVDLCLRARRAGCRVEIVDAGPVVHLQNATRPQGEEDWDDRALLMRRWQSYLEAAFP